MYIVFISQFFILFFVEKASVRGFSLPGRQKDGSSRLKMRSIIIVQEKTLSTHNINPLSSGLKKISTDDSGSSAYYL